MPKKTIKGLTYNTDTATELAHHSSGHAISDFACWSETLYRTTKGNYFLYGEGGPLSRFSQPSGNNASTGGDEIRPLFEDEALEWAELRGEEETIEKYFAHLTSEA